MDLFPEKNSVLKQYDSIQTESDDVATFEELLPSTVYMLVSLFVTEKGEGAVQELGLGLV